MRDTVGGDLGEKLVEFIVVGVVGVEDVAEVNLEEGDMIVEVRDDDEVMARGDFANGFLIAEILHKYHRNDIPILQNLHAFDTGTGPGAKKNNWGLLERCFSRLEYAIPKTLLDDVMNARADAATLLLSILHNRLSVKDRKSAVGSANHAPFAEHDDNIHQYRHNTHHITSTSTPPDPHHDQSSIYEDSSTTDDPCWSHLSGIQSPTPNPTHTPSSPVPTSTRGTQNSAGKKTVNRERSYAAIHGARNRNSASTSKSAGKQQERRQQKVSSPFSTVVTCGEKTQRASSTSGLGSQGKNNSVGTGSTTKKQGANGGGSARRVVGVSTGVGDGIVHIHSTGGSDLGLLLAMQSASTMTVNGTTSSPLSTGAVGEGTEASVSEEDWIDGCVSKIPVLKCLVSILKNQPVQKPTPTGTGASGMGGGSGSFGYANGTKQGQYPLQWQQQQMQQQQQINSVLPVVMGWIQEIFARFGCEGPKGSGAGDGNADLRGVNGDLDREGNCGGEKKEDWRTWERLEARLKEE
ncbi:spermatogenesis-associated protein 4, partial [Quaeritorhiza haematococci]